MSKTAIVGSINLVKRFPSFKDWNAFQSLSQKSKNKKLFTLQKNDNVFEQTKLQPIDKSLEPAYARYDSRNKLKSKPIYSMPTDRSSSRGDRSTTSCQKKTLKQSVIDSQWETRSGRESRANHMDSSYSRGTKTRGLECPTPKTVKAPSTAQPRSVKTETTEWKFNVGIMNKGKSSKNSVSLASGRCFKVGSQKNSARSVVSSIWSQQIRQPRGSITPAQR